MNAHSNTLRNLILGRPTTALAPEPANELDALVLHLTEDVAVDFGVSTNRMGRLLDELVDFSSLMVSMSTVELGARCPACSLRQNGCRIIDPTEAEQVYQQTCDGLVHAALADSDVAANLWIMLHPAALEFLLEDSHGHARDALTNLHRHVSRFRELTSERVEFQRFYDGWIVHLNACRCTKQT